MENLPEIGSRWKYPQDVTLTYTVFRIEYGVVRYRNGNVFCSRKIHEWPGGLVQVKPHQVSAIIIPPLTPEQITYLPLFANLRHLRVLMCAAASCPVCCINCLYYGHNFNLFKIIARRHFLK